MIFYNMEECIWCLNKIVIYNNKIEAENQSLVENALLQYVEDKLVVNLFKFEFHGHKSIFL